LAERPIYPLAERLIYAEACMSIAPEPGPL